MSHVRMIPCYPQYNGRLHRSLGSVEQKCIQPACPATKEEAERLVHDFIEHFNHLHLRSSPGYVTLADKMAGLANEIANERDRKLEKACQRRAFARQAEARIAWPAEDG